MCLCQLPASARLPEDHQKEESGSDATSAESAVSSEIAGTIDKQMSPAEKQLLYFKQHQRIMDKFYRVCLCLQVVYNVHRSRSRHRHQAAAQAKDSFVNTGPLAISF